MFVEFSAVWSVLSSIISALSDDVITSITFVFCAIGVVGVFRSF